MQIIDAVWEKRSLNVGCVEVKIEAADSLVEVRLILQELIADYVVIKVPAERSDIMFLLSELGYTFVEGSINVTKKLPDCELSGIQKRLAESVDYSLMSKNDLRELEFEIRKGMFETDRIYRDPFFSPGQASARYVGWIEDEMLRGTEVYKLTYKGESIGFFTMKDLGGGCYYPFLAGLYERHRHSGLGFNIAHKPMCEIVKRGGKSISTYISTNNQNAIRIHVNLGFSFDAVTYVYVRHNKTNV